MNFWPRIGNLHCQQHVDQTHVLSLVDKQGIKHDFLSSDRRPLSPPPPSTFVQSYSDLRRYKRYRRSRSKPPRRTFHLFSPNGPTSPYKIVSLFRGKRNSIPMDHKSPPPPMAEQPLTIQEAKDVQMHRCYYFAARNCKGWTIGRSPHDACESCWVSFHHYSAYNMNGHN
jgi:hypothetical protein